MSSSNPIYSQFVFPDRLVSPINGYSCKQLSVQNIKFFGFDSVHATHEHYPDFPTMCPELLIKRQIKHPTVSLRAKVKRDDLQQIYYDNPKLCQHCKLPIPYDKRKYDCCSLSCRTSHSNLSRSKESNDKRGKSISSTYKDFRSHYAASKYPPKPKNCVICNKKHVLNGKTCGAECYSVNHSKQTSIAKRRSIENGFNPQLNRGRHKRSYLESSFGNWLDSFQISYIPEQQVKRYNNDGTYRNSYFIDFYFPDLNLGLELDGTQHKLSIAHDKERDTYIESTGIKIVRITYHEYHSKSRMNEIKQMLGIPNI